MRSLSTKISALPPSGTLRMSREAALLRKQGRDIVSLSMGEPDFPTPEHIVKAAEESLRRGETHYVASPGIPRLREEIVKKSQRDNGIRCSADDVIVAPTKQCIYLALAAILNPGDEVLIPDPGWVSYAPQVFAAAGVPIPFEHHYDNKMDLESMHSAVGPKTKAVIVNSPSNPLGSVMTPSEAEGIAALAVENDLYVISDEIYEKLIYEGSHISPAAMDGMGDRTITVNGFSKAYAMTGWRLGWAIAHGQIMANMRRLHEHTLTCLPQFIQEGGIAALTGPTAALDNMIAEFTERRKLLLSLLDKVDGLKTKPPGGAFYVFPRFDASTSSDELALNLLREEGIAVAPGSAFGNCGEGHLRISYAASRDDIEKGVLGLENILQRLS